MQHTTGRGAYHIVRRRVIIVERHSFLIEPSYWCSVIESSVVCEQNISCLRNESAGLASMLS